MGGSFNDGIPMVERKSPARTLGGFVESQGIPVAEEETQEKPLGCLQRSGIVYTIGGPIGKPMIDEPNPFAVLKEDPDHFHLNLAQRLTLTYRVLMGNHYDFGGAGHGRKGLIDIFLFPLLARVLLAQVHSPKRHPFVKFLAGAVGYPLEFLRHALGVVLTIAALPVVILAHFVLSIIGCFRPNHRAVSQVRQSQSPQRVFAREQQSVMENPAQQVEPTENPVGQEVESEKHEFS